MTTLMKRRTFGALCDVASTVALPSDDFADWQEWYHYAGAVGFGAILGALMGGRTLDQA